IRTIMPKSQAVQQNSIEADQMKVAAKFLSQHLRGAGFNVPPDVAHEALTALESAFGAGCLGRLQAAPSQSSLLDTEPRWLVNAIYLDNNQRWADVICAKTALEAQIIAQV